MLTRSCGLGEVDGGDGDTVSVADTNIVAVDVEFGVLLEAN